MTDQDIRRLIEVLKRVFATKEDLIASEERVVDKFSDLQASVDRYLQFTETWHQELTILKSRQARLSQVLIDKGIVSEQELALIG
jgi:hypothetical protein